jgi:hypothetical protein
MVDHRPSQGVLTLVFWTAKDAKNAKAAAGFDTARRVSFEIQGAVAGATAP